MSVLARERKTSKLQIFQDTHKLLVLITRYTNDETKVPKKYRFSFPQFLNEHCNKLLTYITYANNLNPVAEKVARLKLHDRVIAEIECIDEIISVMEEAIPSVTPASLKEIAEILNKLMASALNWRKYVDTKAA